jgi:CBS domain-containing protein
MKVAEILKVKGSTLFTVAPETLLSDAVVTMAENDIGSVVVMQAGRLAGMLTFREVLRVLAARQKEQRIGPTPTMSEIRVGDVMNRTPTLALPDMSVDELRRVMNDCGERYLPVMDDQMLMGVVSFHDVARAVLEAQSFENKMLKAYIRDWPEAES